MKKLMFILLTTAFLFNSVCLYAQAIMTSLEINKQKRNAIMIKIEQPVSLTEDALIYRLKSSGLTGKSKGGLTTYTGVILPEISPDKIDLYTKVEKDSKTSCLIFMTVSKGYDSFINPETDSMIITNLTSFLNSMINETKLFAIDKEIDKKIKELNNEKNKYQSLLDDRKDLERQRDKIEQRLKDNTKDIDRKKSDVDKIENEINDMKLKRNIINKKQTTVYCISPAIILIVNATTNTDSPNDSKP